MRSISVSGLGYVGSVTAACLSEKGNTVLGIDWVSLRKQNRLRHNGKYEGICW